MNAWRGFTKGDWVRKADVGDFIRKNVTPYEGDESFLQGPTDRTIELWDHVRALMDQERTKGIFDADTQRISTIVAHEPGYIQKDMERIVGLQTERPLKRALMPFGGIRMAKAALSSYELSIHPDVESMFDKRMRKTHNDGVFDAYTEQMRLARSSGIITGLPDAYGRGRIIGDYRRVALYGVDKLLQIKREEKAALHAHVSDESIIRLREEASEQLDALQELMDMGASYGFDLSKPAVNATQAIQWTYFGYLAAIKEQNGAAMSLGRVSTFFDIYIERDLAEGVLDEKAAQELVDDLTIKLRMVRFLRTEEYNKLFSGDPVWVTEAVGGMACDGRTLVTKTSFRILQPLLNLGPAPEPNLTVLWSNSLPEGFKRFAADVSVKTSSIQYENDDLMRTSYGDDYAIACCVSAMRIGRSMQFFGARANMAKALLYAINGGIDELTGKQVASICDPIKTDVLEYDVLMQNFDLVMDWLAGLYIDTLNTIHYMHDKYAYERLQMALHDLHVERTSACGIAGLSVVADALAAVRYGRVHVIRNEQGLAVDYKVEGEPPAFGNDDDRVDDLACMVIERFMEKLRKQKAYRDAEPTLSILTITSNVVYGKKTGSTPDGRKKGEPFAPGANPMHGRDKNGAGASMASVAKLPYEHAKDGISYTFSIVPAALGRNAVSQTKHLVGLLDGYFELGGHHINVNVLDKDTLEKAMEEPSKYPQLTIRVSGYAVYFVKLTREQQLDVIARTFHGQ